jgi:hypothetical protein
MLTHGRLRELLRYNKHTGVFTWRVYRSWNARAGDRAGSIEKNGYRTLYIDGANYYASRLAWFYVTGAWPKVLVDHKNQTVGDDRFRNLRLATKFQNSCNSKLQSRNTSGYRGVSWFKQGNKWRAYIVIAGKQLSLGLFDDIEAAHQAYCKAAKAFHGEFYSHG